MFVISPILYYAFSKWVDFVDKKCARSHILVTSVLSRFDLIESFGVRSPISFNFEQIFGSTSGLFNFSFLSLFLSQIISVFHCMVSTAVFGVVFLIVL